MTSVQQVFDKENVGAAQSVKNRVVGLSLKGGQQQDNAGLVTPRRALGNVNRDFGASRNTPLAKKALNLKTPGPVKVFTENSEKPKPRKALSSISENKPQLSEPKSKKTTEGPLSVFCSNATSLNTVQVDDIEHIHKPQEIEDDYEDIFPKRERVSSYLDKLISWRPSCFKRWDIEDGDYVAIDGDGDEQELLVIDDDDEIPARPTLMMRDAATLCEEALYCEVPEPIAEMDISLLDLSDFLNLPQELDGNLSV